ncbi:SGNH/GDSL hydrolase family protein [Cysteiniphilum sp. QT6929]|uniref:SGNH/GDSL hydrolase family protein n=1 Tax=Cysteiniphilum sp. QT6929 TaxID=2975055 RepID=UPI0024B381EA|nr:SGNH/GDSL hydrolase family protein [Cysteiniphilum sp. QT6929]WHN65117.1 SGNH/GDSL hydrolase family protein [Cysteiniphilum sp. QT6929]
MFKNYRKISICLTATLLSGLSLANTSSMHNASNKIDQIVIFGDSLSDNGNLHNRTLHLSIGNTPHNNYYYGRFTNNYGTWADYLANYFNHMGYLSHTAPDRHLDEKMLEQLIDKLPNGTNIILRSMLKTLVGFGVPIASILSYANTNRHGFVLNYAVGGSTAYRYMRLFPEFFEAQFDMITYNLRLGRNDYNDFIGNNWMLNPSTFDPDPNADGKYRGKFIFTADGDIVQPFVTGSLQNQFWAYKIEQEAKNTLDSNHIKQNTLAVVLSGANDYLAAGPNDQISDQYMAYRHSQLNPISFAAFKAQQKFQVFDNRYNYDEVTQKALSGIELLIKNLEQSSVKNIVLVGLPDITKTPRFNIYDRPQNYNELKQKLSTAIDKYNTGLQKISQSDQAARITYIDINNYFTDILEHHSNDVPRFDDYSHACIPIPQDANPSSNTHQLLDNIKELHSVSKLFDYRACIDTNMFWDDVHPNSRVHKYIAKKVISFLNANYNLPMPNHESSCSAIVFEKSAEPKNIAHSYLSGTNCNNQTFNLNLKADIYDHLNLLDDASTTPQSQDRENGYRDRYILYVKSNSTLTAYNSQGQTSYISLNDNAENYKAQFNQNILSIEMNKDSFEPVDFLSLTSDI